MSYLDLFPWFRMPASGDVWQKVTNVTDWFSPKVEMNFAGNPAVESDVNAHVASYGKQLGILTEAVLALESGDKAALKTAASRLREIAAKVEEIKKLHEEDPEDAAKAALDKLAKVGEGKAALKAFLDRYHRANLS